MHRFTAATEMLGISVRGPRADEVPANDDPSGKDRDKPAAPVHGENEQYALVHFQHALMSADPVICHFSWLLLSIYLFTASLIYLKPDGFLGLFGTPVALICAIVLTALLATGDAIFADGMTVRNALLPLLKARAAIVVLLLVSVPIYFASSNLVNHEIFIMTGQLFDDALLEMDRAILGKVFPDGQLALWLDTHSILGPQTLLGKLYGEVLQLFYASYYFWGNGLGLYLAYQYFYLTLYKREPSSLSPRLQWRRLQMFLCAWVGAYLTNFTLNLMFPAVSPRLHIADRYQNDVEFIFIADLIRAAIKKAAHQSYSAFPSGHTALSWIAAIAAYRMGFTRYAKMAGIAAAIITTATVVLRYHYFSDVLFAVPLIVLGLYFGHMIRAADYQAALVDKSKEDDEVVRLP